MTSAASNLKTDERIVLFTTDAACSADGSTWEVPVHAWVYEPEDARKRGALLAAVLKKAYDLELTPQTRPNFMRRVGLLCADNERRKRILIDIAGEQFALPPTDSSGHTRAVLTLPAAQVAGHAVAGALSFQVVLPEGDARIFEGRVNLIASRGLSVISDIDDTIKITEVGETAHLLRRTFFEDFAAASGMAERYRQWAGEGVVFHFVSSSPWHLYEPLDEFMDAGGFPARSMSLKRVRVKDRTLLNLFKKGTQTKPEQITPILARFPARRFVLIGDSGEQDPEVYADICRRFPKQIEGIFIRNVDDSASTDARYRDAFAGIDRWCLFTDPATLELPA